jgi:NTE family protein
MLSRPDVLVLGAGGVLGEAWMSGLLAGIEDATGFRFVECEHFVGTSAGSIVAAHLAAGRPPARPAGASGSVGSERVPVLQAPGQDGAAASPLAAAALRSARRAGELMLAAGTPLVLSAVAAASPGGAVARAAMLRRIRAGRGRLDQLRARIDELGGRFDGRLRVVAVDRARGRRVVFGRPGAPDAGVAEAVQASCTVPWLFEPVVIGGREYVDGGVWSVTNLDVAPAGRETHVLCLNPLAGLRGAHSLLAAARSAARSAVSVEALLLRRRGAHVQMVAPDAASSAAMGADFMAYEPRGRVLAAGFAQGRALGSGSADQLG